MNKEEKYKILPLSPYGQKLLLTIHKFLLSTALGGRMKHGPAGRQASEGSFCICCWGACASWLTLYDDCLHMPRILFLCHSCFWCPVEGWYRNHDKSCPVGTFVSFQLFSCNAELKKNKSCAWNVAPFLNKSLDVKLLIEKACVF